jgi:hypothetical protein
METMKAERGREERKSSISLRSKMGGGSGESRGREEARAVKARSRELQEEGARELQEEGVTEGGGGEEVRDGSV